MASIQGIYIALFGRPADPAGLAFFNQITNNGADLAPMLNVLADEFEYQSRFGGLDNTEIITEIYQSLFGREPDQAGLNFFLNALADGSQTIATIAVNIMEGASGADAQVVDNKVTAADVFTASLDTPEEINAYKGLQAASQAGLLLKTITADPSTIPTESEVDVAVRDIAFPNAALTPGGGSGGGGGGGGGGSSDVTPPATTFPYHWESGSSHGVGAKAEPQSTILVYDSGSLIGTAQADAMGDWHFALPSDDVFSITTRVRDAAGNLSPVSGTSLIGTPGDDDLVAPAGQLGEIYGRGGNDTLTGANVSEISLRGGEGDDHLIAGPAGATLTGDDGEDRLEGGDQFDDVWYLKETGSQGIAVNLDTGVATDTFGKTDTLIKIDGIAATNQDDILIGSNADELFRPYAGNDVIDGAGGSDEVHYGTDRALVAVEVDLAAGTAAKHYANSVTYNDQLTSIERVRGSAGSDTILGDAGENTLHGLAGDDLLDGRDGFDIVDYRHEFRYGATSGVEVNLANGTATDGFGHQDTLSNIEGVQGTNFNDILIGDGNDNYLQGSGGSDQLTGGGGNDVFGFVSALDSSANAAGGPTSILDFRNNAEIDQISIRFFSGSAAGSKIEDSGSVSISTFQSDVRDILNGNEDANFAALVNATSGDLAGRTFLIVDDGNGVFETASDLTIELTGTSVTTGLDAGWFFI